MTVGRVLALDPGERRVGVAVSDPLHMIAQPVGTIDPKKDLEGSVQNLITQWEVERVIVGLPVRLDGGEGTAAEGARRFADVVAAACSIPVEMYDERFSTVVAERVMIEGGARRRVRRERRDSVAAAVFLQGWLDRDRR